MWFVHIREEGTVIICIRLYEMTRNTETKFSNNNGTNELINERVRLSSKVQRCQLFRSTTSYFTVVCSFTPIAVPTISQLQCWWHFHFQLILWRPHKIFSYRKLDIPVVIFSRATLLKFLLTQHERGIFCFREEIFLSALSLLIL